MKNRLFVSLTLLCLFSCVSAAEGIEPALQAKIDARTAELKTWASDPVIVKAVTAHNARLPAESAAITQDKWKAFTILDPFVRSFSRNEAGLFLKSKKAPWIGEMFLSGRDGLKVAFLSKPSSWSHAGKPKHDVPLSGKTWQGTLELDDSTGLQQIQVAIPVLDQGKPIGSLVVGMGIAHL